MVKNRVHQEILDAMQNLEEMGGVNDTREYIEVMTALRKEINSRIFAASRTPDVCVADIAGCGCISCNPPSGAV